MSGGLAVPPSPPTPSLTHSPSRLVAPSLPRSLLFARRLRLLIIGIFTEFPLAIALEQVSEGVRVSVCLCSE